MGVHALFGNIQCEMFERTTPSVPHPQHDFMYALVGCSDVVWSIGNVLKEVGVEGWFRYSVSVASHDSEAMIERSVAVTPDCGETVGIDSDGKFIVENSCDSLEVIS